MLFQLNIHLSEDDYLSYNTFHALESAYGKKMLNKSRIILILVTVIPAALVIQLKGLTKFSVIYAALSLLFLSLYMIFREKGIVHNIKSNIKHLKQAGKLPFDPISTIEFYEDKMVEITALERSEHSYLMIERVCVVQDRYLFLYRSSLSAYILPIEQVKAQVNQADFIAFLSKKCTVVEYY